MCFHSYDEMIAYEKRVSGEGKIGFVIMRDPKTNLFQEAYFCIANSVQSIANTVRNLRVWHPGERRIDFSHINKTREKCGLFSVNERELPPPTGTCPPSEDAAASVDTFRAAKERMTETA